MVKEELFEKWCNERYNEYMHEMDVIVSMVSIAAMHEQMEMPSHTPVTYQTFKKVCKKLADSDPNTAKKFTELKQWLYTKDPLRILCEPHFKLAKQYKVETSRSVSPLMVKLALLTMGAKLEEKDFADC